MDSTKLNQIMRILLIAWSQINSVSKDFSGFSNKATLAPFFCITVAIILKYLKTFIVGLLLVGSRHIALGIVENGAHWVSRS